MKKAKLTAALAVVFIVNILLISLSQEVGAVAYRQGSSGSVVTRIQQRLRDWGYYTYAVDGIYGSRTTAAVKKFQKANGLTADGICGEKTLAALGLRVPAASADGNTRALLARLISAEARGEPYVGQVQLVSGEIGEDFAMYFTASEQTPSLVSVAPLTNSTVPLFFVLTALYQFS